MGTENGKNKIQKIDRHAKITVGFDLAQAKGEERTVL